jgi:hypothetical protein
MREMHEQLERELETLAAEWEALRESDLPALNAKARGLDLEFVPVPE